MQLTPAQIDQRRPLWAAMADLFLDTETRWYLPTVAAACASSGLDDAALEQVFWCEVFPLAIPNLLGIAGEWASLALDESELCERAARGARDGLAESRSAWRVKAEWEASLAFCRRLRHEPARAPALVRLWTALGKCFLASEEPVPPATGLPCAPAVAAVLAEARAAAIDPGAEWAFCEPVLRGVLHEREQASAPARSEGVRALLAACEA